jgi:hypothetical protein
MNFDCHQSIKDTIEFWRRPNSKYNLILLGGLIKTLCLGRQFRCRPFYYITKISAYIFIFLLIIIDLITSKRLEKLAKQFSTNITVYVMDAEGLKIFQVVTLGHTQPTSDLSRLSILAKRSIIFYILMLMLCVKDHLLS